MDILERAWDEKAWDTYYQKMEQSDHVYHGDLVALERYIAEKQYRPLLERLRAGERFPLPQLRWINKKGTDKKRLVFAFGETEGWLLKFFGWQLHQFDDIFSDTLYSFRKGRDVKLAIRRLTSLRGIETMYGQKMDIHDYFNSVDIARLLPELQAFFQEHPAFYALLEDILTNPYALDGETPVVIQKGIMAGSPLSPFLANFYLRELDRHMEKQGLVYARYSDDILLFAPSAAEREAAVTWLQTFLAERGLTLNPKKVSAYEPGEPWEFLGVRYHRGRVDVSPVSVDKMKAKLRRKARAVYRWKLRRGATDEAAIRAYIRAMNRKFYANEDPNDLTWARWYFPLINTTDSLHTIDRYMQECIRYLATGRHSKANYNLRYETMRACGYRPLVAAYYQEIKKEGEET